jgi:DNA-directed RNA polymerase subunit RPC12/RpoP
MSDKQLVFKCLECGKINIYPKHKHDGNTCADCKGNVIPIGELADNCNRVKMFIKTETLIDKATLADRIKSYYRDEIIPVDCSQKVVMVDRFTGEVISEL